ncbi:uncharacterized protein VP01_10589g1, partial [Puccinia sorghi]
VEKPNDWRMVPNTNQTCNRCHIPSCDTTRSRTGNLLSPANPTRAPSQHLPPPTPLPRNHLDFQKNAHAPSSRTSRRPSPLTSEQLQAKLANLMAVVTEERRLCQLAKIELRKIRGKPPPCAPSPTAHPLACLPEQFDGTCGPAEQAFLQKTGLYCLAHPDQLPDECSKIIFMLTNLSGNATKWAQPLNQRVLNKSDPD